MREVKKLKLEKYEITNAIAAWLERQGKEVQSIELDRGCAIVEVTEASRISAQDSSAFTKQE